MAVRRRRKGSGGKNENENVGPAHRPTIESPRVRIRSQERPKLTDSQTIVLYVVMPIIILSAAVILSLFFVPKLREADSSAKSSTPTLNAPNSHDSIDAQPTTDDGDETQTQFTGVGTFQLLNSIPHDPKAFTQGLFLWNKSIFFESTGMYGESQVRKVSFENGSVLQFAAMDPQYFGEGMAYYEVNNGDGANGRQGRLIQLTWQEKTGFVYDSETLAVVQNFTYDTFTGEGWGITQVPPTRGEESSSSNGYFLVSDGSHYLMRWDVDSLQEVTSQRVPVTLRRRDMSQAAEIRSINELEWDPFQPDTVLANVWMQDVIVRIDLHTGFIRKIYDLQTLFMKRPAGVDVLNGIAVTDEPNVIWVTGKYWPRMYRVRLLDPSI